MSLSYGTAFSKGWLRELTSQAARPLIDLLVGLECLEIIGLLWATASGPIWS